MSIADENLMALADGEITGAQARALEAEIARDPALQESYRIFVETAALLRAERRDEPVPEHLVAAIRAAPVGGLPASDTNVIPFRRKALPKVAWGAIAAALVLGIGLGFWGGAPKSGRLPLDLTAYAALPSGETRESAAGLVRAIGSYQTDLGLCRDLTLEAAAGLQQAVICRGDQGWQTALWLLSPPSAGYLTASDALSAGLDAFLEGIGAGPALSTREEAEALAAN